MSHLNNGLELQTKLRDRYEAWAADGFPRADNSFPDLLPRLNSGLDVVTVFGCEGHVGEEGKDDDYRFYIMFAVSTSGFARLLELHKNLMEACTDSEMRCCIELHLGHSADLFLHEFTAPFFPTYPTVVLDFPFNHVEDKNFFIGMLHQVLDANPL